MRKDYMREEFIRAMDNSKEEYLAEIKNDLVKILRRDTSSINTDNLIVKTKELDFKNRLYDYTDSILDDLDCTDYVECLFIVIGAYKGIPCSEMDESAMKLAISELDEELKKTISLSNCNISVENESIHIIWFLPIPIKLSNFNENALVIEANVARYLETIFMVKITEVSVPYMDGLASVCAEYYYDEIIVPNDMNSILGIKSVNS
ncbi:MAG: hypothetical protein WBL93_10510 [Lutisporaceae bacterium]